LWYYEFVRKRVKRKEKKMTTKDMSPEIALANTLEKIQNVLHSVTNFARTHNEETFEASDYNKFRDSSDKIHEYNCGGRWYKTSEYVSLQTLRNYGVVTVVAKREEEIIANPTWRGDVCHRLNNGKIIDDYKYQDLCNIFDDADTLFEIEHLEGMPVTVKIYTYKIDETRFMQLQNIASTLQKIVVIKE
jgi:ribosome-binding ATPase YchF (GTP1/OBG family)